MIVAICILLFVVVLETFFIINNYENLVKTDKTFDANVQGFLLTKSDRINKRIDDFAVTVKKQNSLIDIKDFAKFVKSIQVLIAQELTYKGIYKRED